MSHEPLNQACPYCHAHAILRDASAVYGEQWAGKFKIWVCVNFPTCDSYVGTHRTGNGEKPLGTLANAELRDLRKKVHALFDPMWKSTDGRFFGKGARKRAYWWITDQLGVTGQFHTGSADEELCRRAIAVLEKDLEDEARDPRNCEPECNCIQIDVDREDASMCELHNLNSPWHLECRRWDLLDNKPTVPLFAPVYAGITDDDCPF